MRHLRFYLFGFAMLVAACQPLTPTTVNTKAAPTITIATNDQTEIDVVVSTVTKTADSGAGSVTDAVTNFGFGTESSSGTINSTEETVIAAIPATPPVQPALVQPPLHPKTMIGSASIILVRDLGIANMIRQEGLIQIWQYRFDACVVDFFFYPASQGSSQLVIKDWDIRSVVIGDRVNEGKCLAAIDRHHQKLVVGS
ncbi:hypothetical protein N8Z70_01430 [Candidatus Puniceispirillum sp.]|nr:hypothetical protein [Candidatus Puniceispirillum sp.]